MNESILINNSVLRLPQLMRKRKREKDEEKALPLSFYGALSILWLCSAIRRCVSLSLLLSLPLCVSSVCVRARVSASLQFILGTPVVSVRHRAAWTHSGTAKRSARETEISSPPSSVVFFFYPSSLPSLPRPPLSRHTQHKYTHTHTYTYTQRETHSPASAPWRQTFLFSAHLQIYWHLYVIYKVTRWWWILQILQIRVAVWKMFTRFM